ncbi:V-snare-domain-containing protein [Ramicandelaber brevisporus]|nr:V-snare-domain-containing protein [Ramicandelaber brevisporus]
MSYSKVSTIDPESSSSSNSSNTVAIEIPVGVQTSTRRSWEQLRKAARGFEAELEAKILRLSQLTSSLGDSVSSSSYRGDSSYYLNGGKRSPAITKDSPRENLASLAQMDADIDRIVADLTQAVEDMAAIVNDRSQPSVPGHMHILQRHRDILYDYNKEVRRCKRNAEQAKQRLELMAGANADRSVLSETDALATERSRIDNSNQIADETLLGAHAIHAQLMDQHAAITRSGQRAGNVTENIPGVNYLLTQIGARRRRDRIILATVISIGCIIVIWKILL